MRANPKLIDKLSTLAGPDASHVIAAAQSAADRAGVLVFAVGGTVRDLLLGTPSVDLDLVVEGEAAPLARAVAEQCGGTVAKTTRFGTATIRAGSAAADFAGTRAETYARPGALPDVSPATIAEDLRRRDFTANAIALALNGPDAGTLVDPTGGQADIGDHVVRVIHDRSFRDDATRILRAVRYEARLGFPIEEHTLGLLRRDLGYLQTITPARIHQELRRTMAEREPECALSRLGGLGALRAIHPALAFGSRAQDGAHRLRSICSRARIRASYWPLLVLEASSRQVPGLASRLALIRGEMAVVSDFLALRKGERRLAQELKASKLAAILDGHLASAIAALAATAGSETARENATEYLTRLRFVRPVLRGDDVLALGVPAGPAVGDVLRRLKAAKLDGEVRSRRDEERFVARYLARKRQ